MDLDFENDYERLIIEYLGKAEIKSLIQEMVNSNKKRLCINLDNLRNFHPQLAQELLRDPATYLSIFERHLQDITTEILNASGEKVARDEKTLLDKKQVPYKMTVEGTFGKNMVSPRGLNANLANQFVCVQGIVTRASQVRPKLVHSVHFCEETRQGTVKEYNDQYTIKKDQNTNNVGSLGTNGAQYLSNAVPTKDIHGNALSFEYGLSFFRDIQTVLVQEPPERTPLGQLPRSVEVILEDDLVDKIKPGDRVQIVGVYKCISGQSTSFTGTFKTVLMATSAFSTQAEIEAPRLTGEDLRNIKEIAKRKDFFEVLASSLSPSIYGHDKIKKALLLLLSGGVEKNLQDGTHLRGDINVLLIGDPSTAKSQFLRHIMSLAPNAINTTGRGSSGVGLTAAVVVDKDTGERHLEAGAMVLADRGIVCIDEFDKMSEIDRVAIHEVMEQQTVTIAKAGIHCSLNARCSVLAAANPIYGEYQKDLSASKNIGLPDSLLSRFDLVFTVLDEHNPVLDRLIADRVIRNHQMTDNNPMFNIYDEKIIEPDLNIEDQRETQVFEKNNNFIGNSNKNEVLTKSFLRKYLHYSKKMIEPNLGDDSIKLLSDYWTELRNDEKDNENKAVPITVRTLESLIRLASAHAKLRLSKIISKADCEVAFELLRYALYHDKDKEDNLEEEAMEVDEVPGTPVKSGKANTRTTRRTKGMIDDEDDDEEEDEEDEESRSRSRRTPVKRHNDVSDDVNKVFGGKPSSNFVVDEEKQKLVYKIIRDAVYKRTNQQMTLDELWTMISSNEATKSIASKKSDVLDIVLVLDNDGSVHYSSSEKQITLI